MTNTVIRRAIVNALSGVRAGVLGVSAPERAVLALHRAGVAHVAMLVRSDDHALRAHLARNRRLRENGSFEEVLVAPEAAASPPAPTIGAAISSTLGAEGGLLVDVALAFEPSVVSAVEARVTEDPAQVWSVAGGGLAWLPGWLASLPAMRDASVEDILAIARGRGAMGIVDTPGVALWARERGERRRATRALLTATRKPTDGPVSRWLNRPLSLATTRLLAPLGVTPNLTTTVVFLLGVAAAYLAAQPDWTSLLVAAALTQLASVWDGCDGELARVRLRASRFGAWYDTISDNLRYILLVVGCAIGVYARHDSALALAAGGLFVAGAIYLVAIMVAHLVRTRERGTHLVVVARVEARASGGARSPVQRFFHAIRILGKQDVLALGAAVALAVGLPHLVLAGGLIAVFGMIAVVAPALAEPTPRLAAARRRRTTERRGGRGRWLPAALGVAGVGVLVAVVSRFPLAEIGEAWRTMGWPVLATPLVALAWFAANTSGTYRLFAGRVPWRVLLVNRLMGEAYNALLPVAGVGGEPVKAHHLSRHVPGHEAIAIVVVDRLVNVISGLLFSAACLAYGLLAFSWPTAAVVPGWIYIGLALAFGAVLGLVAVSRAPGRFGSWALVRFGRGGAAALDRVPSRRFAQALGWHLLGRAAMTLEVVLLLHLLGLDTSLSIVVAITGLLAVAGALSFAIPQSLGIAEAASVFAFQLVGFPAVLGIAFGLVRRGRTLAVSVVGLAVHLAYVRGRTRAPASASSPGLVPVAAGDSGTVVSRATPHD